MFGVYVFAGGFLAALATVTLLVHFGARAGLLPGVGASHAYALGRLLLSFVIFWAYIAFFQFLIIWIAHALIYRWRTRLTDAQVEHAIERVALPFRGMLDWLLARIRARERL